MRISDWSSDVCSSDLRPRIENHSSTGAGADGLERHSTGEVPLLIHGFKKWPKNQKIALPILTIFEFGSLFNQLQGRQSEPTSIFVDNTRRSEERRVGNACVSTCRSRWSPEHSNKRLHKQPTYKHSHNHK